MAKHIIPEIEREWECRIALDAKLLQEAFLRAEITIGNIEIESPNHFKQAGHYGFWIRKMKPLRIIDTADFSSQFEYLRSEGIVIGDITPLKHIQKRPRSKYVNEIFAILVAIGIVNSFGVEHMRNASKEFIKDLAVNLRYQSFSPSAFAAIIEAKSSQA